MLMLDVDVLTPLLLLGILGRRRGRGMRRLELDYHALLKRLSRMIKFEPISSIDK